MIFRLLGNTGLPVSTLSLGTVELGLDYGFRQSSSYHRPERAAAARVLSHAVDHGINLLDTAPTYGESESMIGEALASLSVRPWVATKVTIGDDLSAITQSVDRSLRRLQLETIDILQVHNATAATLRNVEAWSVLEQAVRAGKVRLLGASVYAEEDAAEALANPCIRVLQIPFNLLDQKMAARIIPLAARQGVGVLVRSAFLRGVLTAQVTNLPAELMPLVGAARKAVELAGEPLERIADLALRFCLTVAGVASVIVGVRSITELDANLAAAGKPPLDSALLRRLRACDLSANPLVSPLQWTGLI